jgi:hypothetical protein
MTDTGYYGAYKKPPIGPIAIVGPNGKLRKVPARNLGLLNHTNFKFKNISRNGYNTYKVFKKNGKRASLFSRGTPTRYYISSNGRFVNITNKIVSKYGNTWSGQLGSVKKNNNSRNAVLHSSA